MRKSTMAEQPRTFRPKRLALSFKLRSARLIARIYLLSLSPIVLGELEPHTSTLEVIGTALPRRPRREGGEATTLVAATTQGGEATTQGGEATTLVAATTQGGKATTIVAATTLMMR